MPTLPGYGETPEDAWEDAVQTFGDDSGDVPDGYKITDFNADPKCRKVE